MKLRITTNINDGKAEAPGFNFDLDIEDGHSFLELGGIVGEELINDVGKPLSPGTTVLIEVIE